MLLMKNLSLRFPEKDSFKNKKLIDSTFVYLEQDFPHSLHH